MAVSLIAPIALREVLPPLITAFEGVHGLPVATTFLLNPEIPGHIRTGAAFDVAISNPEHLHPLIADGLADPRSLHPLVRAPLVFAHLGGDRAPPARTMAEIAQVLLAARSIAYTGAGTSGKMLKRVLDALDLTETLADRLIPLEGGGPRQMVLAGACDLAAIPHTNIAGVPGTSIAAICPPEMDVHIHMSLILPPHASDAARALADYLLDPALDAALQATGAERFGQGVPSSEW